ncbi:major facilitator superfamily domain-containing protein [Hysterangium stoloniferum]|nr:major facilitator superfamily domain-containing protein [Hysterangium stoloniferum]
MPEPFQDGVETFELNAHDDHVFDSPYEAVSRSLIDSDSTLVGEEEVDVESASKARRVTPVPKLQVMTLCAVRIVDPISFTQLFPYVNAMMIDLHVTTHASRIGFYSGLVDSAFAISQLFSIYHWGKLSDRVGRRPVIFSSTLGIALCTTWFGISKTLWSALAARCVSGLLAGNIAVVHSTLGELSDVSNQAIIFPIYGMVWPLGGIIGPLIGGTFSHPDIRWPEHFDTEWFREHPYFLPCFICSALSFTAASFGHRFLEETHPLKRTARNPALNHSDKPIQGGFPADVTLQSRPQSTSIRTLLANPLIRALCFSGGALAFLSSAFDVVFVLFCFSPITSGGLSRPTDEIGYSLAVAGFTSVVLQLFLMPWLLRKFDLDSMYRLCMGLFPFIFVALPLLNLLARSGVSGDDVQVTVEWIKVALWSGIIVTLAMSRVAVLSFSFNLILVKESAPSPESLGSTNGLTQWFQCVARSVSPAFVSSMFALSVDRHLLGGYLWVIVMIGLSIGSNFVTANIPAARACSRHNRRISK